jgi:hypothetical protein
MTDNQYTHTPTTGLSSLDGILTGIRPGDNVVWQIDEIEDYAAFVDPFVSASVERGAPVVYFRFASHRELVAERAGVRIERLEPRDGFEAFITRIREVIGETGRGACFVFDLHSELARDIYGDRMLGNFFKLTCPYLYELETIAYFAVYRLHHSFHAAQPVNETTQLLIDVYRHGGRLYVHPLKVDGRFSPTIFNMHVMKGETFIPVLESSEIAEVLATAPWPGLQSASYRLIGQRDRRFMQAEEILEGVRNGTVSSERERETFLRLLSQIFSDDPPIVALAERYLSLGDLIYLWKRMIGGGRVGGKTAGMLLARAILQASHPRWRSLLAAHDSFFIGSDVFYTFLTENRCWELRQKQKNPATFLDDIEEARARIMSGSFADYILRRFGDMLDYYGQTPIIVRSSSLLEDNFGNAFAGKYESVFCPNQGSREKRLAAFLDAVRVIYASTMSEEALTYRARRGVLDQDEQMALLVQRVSGRSYGRWFLPQMAGVGFSFNPYVWNDAIDPAAGMLRLVVGLGTRAVDRADDDYTRVMALNVPELRPEGGFEQAKKYAQRRVDAIDLEANRFSSAYFVDLASEAPDFPVSLYATLDEELLERARESGRPSRIEPWVVTFERIMNETTFLDAMRDLLSTLREAYGREVDVEFAANFRADLGFTINLLQCRPFQIRVGLPTEEEKVPEATPGETILKAHDAVIGQGRIMAVERIVYVVPREYGQLGEQDRHAVARLIGRIAHQGESRSIMLIGPGRWGTHMPSLGVPVTFSEINSVTVLCEIDTMHEGLVPDLSLGTHFFNEMVEEDMLYLAYFSSKKENRFDDEFLLKAPNQLAAILPEDAARAKMVRVIDAGTIPGAECFYLKADSLKRVATLFHRPLSARRPRRGRRR